MTYYASLVSIKQVIIYTKLELIEKVTFEDRICELPAFRWYGKGQN